MRAETILDTIGKTPHVRIHRLFDPRVEVWMKLSVQTRAEASRTASRSR